MGRAPWVSPDAPLTLLPETSRRWFSPGVRMGGLPVDWGPAEAGTPYWGGLVKTQSNRRSGGRESRTAPSGFFQFSTWQSWMVSEATEDFLKTKACEPVEVERRMELQCSDPS